MKSRWKKITSGNLVKEAVYSAPLPRDNPQQRAAKHKITTAAQKRLNFRTAQGKLELKLAANFTWKDYFITLTYKEGQEPKSRKEVKTHKAQYMRKLRTQRKRRGQDIKWVCSIENRHGEGRYHLHAVISAADPYLDIDEIKSLWPYGHVEVSCLFDTEHKFNYWSDIARYMTKERPEDGNDSTPVGAQIYSCSRNLSSPKTETGWIENSAPLDAPPGAIVLEQEEVVNEFGRFKYIKYLTAPLFRRE